MSIVAAPTQALLYSMSFVKGVPTIVPGIHSTFRTSDRQSIQNIRGFAYTKEARGKFSRVQTIEDTNKQRYVIKHMKGPHYSPDLALHEVQNLIKCIGNPQVVQILGADIYSSEAFIVFNHVPGKTLHDYINQKPPPHREEVIRRYSETTNAILNLHEIGLAHLDINPNNIWVPDDPRTPAILLDLGSMDVIGEERTVMTGTPGYYPVFGNLAKADPKLNLYGMGAVVLKHPPALHAAATGAMGGAGGPSTGGTPINMTNVYELKGGMYRRRRNTTRLKKVSKSRKRRSA